jgi:23S rRNA pseudouridine1911/1915/1917 synthase
MSDAATPSLVIGTELQGATLAAVLRSMAPQSSWSQARRLVESRRVTVNNEPCLDPARRLKAGDVVTLAGRPAKLPEAFTADLVVRHFDAHVVVVEKPPGISTVRHPTEKDWPQHRRDANPTLDDRLHRLIAAQLGQPLHSLPRLRKVHRLDKLTSGLVVFARTATAERELARQFFRHTVTRNYLAVVPGRMGPVTIRTWLIPDRGDGRRGSSGVEGRGKLAVTHVEVVEELPNHTLLRCRLETGRTHQIRIHLSELGYPICGDPVYKVRPNGKQVVEDNSAPRLALHAAELGFNHPTTGERLNWQMPMPKVLDDWIQSLRKPAGH